MAVNRQLVPERLIPAMMKVCEALNVLHQNGMIQMNLRPIDIMLFESQGEKDSVKLVDFFSERLAHSAFVRESKLTREAYPIMRIPIGLSPEQLNEESLDARTDIYSVGVLMYEALSGQPVFQGNSGFLTLFMHRSDPPKPFSSVNPQLVIPRILEEIVLKALSKQADRRQQTMIELREDLAFALEQIGSSSTS